ncbi:MAG: site-specific integrase [Peptococcaceae bacterium]|nr:site-specific integrase [Peptococcaceae bacterium]
MATIQNKGGNNWILFASAGNDIKGKRIRPTKAFIGTERQALKAATIFEDEVKNGRYCVASKEFTLAEFTKIWFEDYADKQLAPKTVHKYREMLNSRILPTIGNLKMDKIKPMVINRFMGDLADMPRLDKKPGKLSSQTLKHYFRCISAILQDAVEWDIIPENPCLRVKPPRVTKVKIKVYDEDETLALLDALETAKIKHKALVWLEFATGLREGEMMGLEWKDIDFDENTISIERASQYLPNLGVFTKLPKNEGSKRVIAIPKNVAELLKQYRVEWLEDRLKLGDLWKGSDRLFVTWDGDHGHPYWPGQWLAKFLKDNNLKHCSFHSLRHLNATMSIKVGVPLKNISSRLGHTDIGTTANIYADALKSVDREAAEKLGAMLERKSAKNSLIEKK